MLAERDRRLAAASSQQPEEKPEDITKRLAMGTQGSVMDPDDLDYEYAVAANRDDY